MSCWVFDRSVAHVGAQESQARRTIPAVGTLQCAVTEGCGAWVAVSAVASKWDLCPLFLLVDENRHELGFVEVMMGLVMRTISGGRDLARKGDHERQ